MLMSTRLRNLSDDYLLEGTASRVSTYRSAEHPSRLRLDLPFPAIVRGVDATGDRFQEEVVLDSFSPQDLSLRLWHPVRHGTRLFICVRFGLGPGMQGRGARVALHGTVLRTTGQPDGRCGITVTFEGHRFLYVADA